MPISEFTGEEIDTNSEAWRHECECRQVLDKLPDSATRHRHVFGAEHRSNLFRFNTATGKEEPRDDVKPHRWSIYGQRGLAEADRIMSGAIKLHELRKARKATTP